MVWEHWMAGIVYIFAGALHFSGLCLRASLGLEPGSAKGMVLKSILWPLDVLRRLLFNGGWR